MVAVSDPDRTELEVSTDLSEDLDIDLGLDEDLAAMIRETDGVDPSESPQLSERIAVLHLLGEVKVALLQGRDLDRDDLIDHLGTIEDLERSSLIKEVEIEAADHAADRHRL